MTSTEGVTYTGPVYGPQSEDQYDTNYNETLAQNIKTFMENHSLSHSSPISEYVVIEIGRMQLTPQIYVPGFKRFSITLCGFNYLNYLYKIEYVIKMRDWFFCLEQYVEPGMNESPDSWSIGVFHKRNHYKLMEVVCSDVEKLKAIYFNFILSKFLAVMYPFETKGCNEWKWMEKITVKQTHFEVIPPTN